MKRIVPLVLLPALLAAALAAGDEKAAVSLDKNGEPTGLHHHHRWSKKIGQGAQPQGEIAFKNLAALGYTTILTVDGAIPQVELAKKHGLAYVHVPIGYDGIDESAAARIVAAVQRSKGPVYIHCHHGKHRGPAAAMLARRALEKVSAFEAAKAMKASGTSPKYAGLYRDVKAFEGVRPEVAAKVPAKLPSAVKPEGVRGSMVQVDRRFGFLKQSRSLEWGTLPDNPDVSPAHEARMLWELYRELRRLPEATKERDGKFHALALRGEKAVVALEEALRAGDREGAEKAYRTAKQNCNDCHGAYRN